MSFDATGYGVVVTGGASGVGLGFTEALAGAGARVTMLDFNAGALEEQVGRLTGAGLAVRGAQVDVTQHARLDAAIDDAAREYGRLDVVFANAGIDPGPGFVNGDPQRTRNPAGALENYTDERWTRVIDISLNAVFSTVRAAARHMRPRRSGRILITTSLAAFKCEPLIGSAYMAAKAGAAHFMRSAAMELAADNITVNAIAPGFTVTNIGGGFAQQPQVQQELARLIPMHRVGFPEDLKGLALFLCSPAAGYITGQHIAVDGAFGLGFVD
jgi:NAD(P)-dependent dehydrogenase (short-subunit alcohol dehydrogenase family)